MGQFEFNTRLLACCMLILLGQPLLAAEDPIAKQSRLFEMRIYTTHPGKLPDLNRRFRDHTNRIFEKHGMQLIGYWTPTEGEESENTLIYILAYPDRESREKSWKAFAMDMEWKKAREESEKDGPIVKKVETKFLSPTDYSPIK